MQNSVKGGTNLSEGAVFLVENYGEYAKEILLSRAVPNIDGFKPSQRRILYAMRELEKVKGMTKSSAVVGTVLKLHPHGDTSAYETLVRQVDKHKAISTPFIVGKGSFGNIVTSDSPAAMRYTDVDFSAISDELFGELKSVKMIPTEDGHYKEPVTLPVSFPNILVNASSGIAVGLSSNILPNNFHDVIKAAIELEETGKIEKPLVPDFPTGGEVVYNEKELDRIMRKGKGKVRLRGTWEIQGKSIFITSVPYYAKVDSIKKKSMLIEGVSSVKDLADIKHTVRLEIICKNKNVVGQVLHEVLRTTDLQMNMTSNTVVIIDDRPRIIGVTELLSEWLTFRKGVVAKDLQMQIESLNRTIRRLEVFTDLLGNEKRRNEFLETLVKSTDSKARQLLIGWYSDADKDTVDYILDLKVRQFSNYEGRMKTLNSNRQVLKDTEYALENISETIIKQLKDINARYSFPRQTTVTDVDYDFSDYSKEQEKVVVPVIFNLTDKFIKKVENNRINESLEGIRCMSNDVISLIDNQGRLFRVDLDKLDFSSMSDRGIYLPTYLEIKDDFEIVVEELIENKKVGYVYPDGYVTVVDYGEWVNGQRTTKVTQNGVYEYSEDIMAEFSLDSNYLYAQTNKGRFGFFTTDFKIKNRTARTKVIKELRKDEYVTTAVPVSFSEMSNLVTNSVGYLGALNFLETTDKFDGDYLKELLNR